jgi:hypothetical protein
MMNICHSWLPPPLPTITPSYAGGRVLAVSQHSVKRKVAGSNIVPDDLHPAAVSFVGIWGGIPGRSHKYNFSFS